MKQIYLTILNVLTLFVNNVSLWIKLILQMLASGQLLWCLFSSRKFQHHSIILGFSLRFCSALINIFRIKTSSEEGSSLPFSHTFPYLWLAVLILESDTLAGGSTSHVIIRIQETPQQESPQPQSTYKRSTAGTRNTALLNEIYK